jgi:hypothetical protein
MNWNYWLPWREYPQDDGKDSNYEDEVIDRCDHEWGGWCESENGKRHPVLAPQNRFYPSPRIEDGYLVFTVVAEKMKYCKFCGEAMGPRLVDDGEAAIALDFVIDSDRSISDALSCSDKGDSGRILVNESEQEDDGAPLVPVTEEPQAEDKPTEAGGPTD